MAVIRKLAKDLQSSCYKVSRKKKTVLMTDSGYSCNKQIKNCNFAIIILNF